MLLVIWSGTLERNKACPSLSSYEGPSMLSGVMERTPCPTPTDSARWRRPASRVTQRSLVEAFLARGCSLSKTMKETGASYHLVKKVWQRMQGDV